MSYKRYGDLAEKQDEEKKLIETSPHVLHISSSEEKRHLISRNRLCIVNIWGTWCGPCKSMAGPYAKLAEKYGNPGQIAFIKEDVSLNLSPSVKAVPVIQFFFEGKLVHEIIGPDIKGIEATINELSNK